MADVVVGAGVVGQVYAGLLSEAGHEVALVARGARAERLRVDGVVTERDGVRRTHACRIVSDVAAAGDMDTVIVAVRGDQLASVLPDVAASAAGTVDEWAARDDVPPQLRAEPSVTSDRLLATIARLAVAALRQPERVRVCGADDCAVMYLDISRSGNRAWCSMKRCGNRHKVRALRARRAAPAQTTDSTRRSRQEKHS